jgi:hypothetical protein
MNPSVPVILVALLAPYGCGGLAASSADAGHDAGTFDATMSLGTDSGVPRLGPPDAPMDAPPPPDVTYGPCSPADAGEPDEGGCGLGCGGVCSSGRCVTTLSPLSGPSYSYTGLALDDTNVYVVDPSPSTVTRVPKGGGEATAISLGAGSVPGAIAVDAKRIYWENPSCDAKYGCFPSGSLMSAPLSGVPDGGAPTTLASAQPALWGIAMDSTGIYWMNGEATTAAVVKVPLAGGAVTTLASAPVGSYADSVVGALAVDATFVYWVARDAVMRVPIEGGKPTTLAPSGAGVHAAIALSATDVYWTTAVFQGLAPDDVTGAVMSVSKNGGTAATVASGQRVPWSVAVDATSVYWTTDWQCTLEHDGAVACPLTVMKAPLCGGAPTTLSPDQGGQVLAVDATSVYWLSGGASDALMKLTPK